jgi:hypothetical protein
MLPRVMTGFPRVMTGFPRGLPFLCELLLRGFRPRVFFLRGTLRALFRLRLRDVMGLRRRGGYDRGGGSDQ